MKQQDEKERNETVEKIINLLSGFGKSLTPRNLAEFLDKEKKASGSKSEEDYQKEQAEWLENVKKRKEKKS
jgi:predicted subunit of tRNA(5-methylaminomethyl-2-thiouridylate) methyltransferase